MEEQEEFAQIKQWFYHPNTKIPKSLKIGCETMNDVSSTIRSLIRYVEANQGKKRYLAYFEQLKTIYKYLNKKNYD